MWGEWPLVGRGPELARILDGLGQGAAGVVLAGPPGVGKTRLASAALEGAAAAGRKPIRVRATEAISALPLGPFATLLPDLTASLSRAEMVRQVAQAIVARGEGLPVALLV